MKVRSYELSRIDPESLVYKLLSHISDLLPRKKHHKDCPVRHKASVCCCWPIAVCLPVLVAKEFTIVKLPNGFHSLREKI